MTTEKAFRLAMIFVYVLAGMGLARQYDDCRAGYSKTRSAK